MGEYSGLSLHDELAARFAEAENNRLEEEFLSRGWTPPAKNEMQREMYDTESVIDRLKKMDLGITKPKLRALFDGENYIVSDADNIYGMFRAMAGRKGLQRKSAVDMDGRGPIPEGEWLMKNSDFEPLNNDHPLIKSGKLENWGRYRAKLTPLMSSDERYGRDGFYDHGSYNGRGSDGCIDLGLEMPGLVRIFQAYGKDIPLTVKYKADSWWQR